MSHRNHRQIRVIKLYAKKINADFDTAFGFLCESGLAARWAASNED